MNRRLQIMPEVLPAPTATPQSDVRQRTLAHMQRLLAWSGARAPMVAATAVMPMACTKADTQSAQTVTIPSATASASQAANTHGTLIPEVHPSATATATATAPDIGYAVVDPMPAPARCMGLAAATHATATLVADASGPVLDLHVTLPTGAPWSGTTFVPGQTPSPWGGGGLVSSSVSGTSARARVRAAAATTSIGLSFSVSCPAGPGSISVTAMFTTATAGAKVTLQKNDY